MGKLHIFNPENDLALAFGRTNYTAPPSARKIRHDLQLLPLWFANAGDAVYADNQTDNRSFVREIKSDFGIDAEIWEHGTKVDAVSPWGWSAAIYEELKRIGIQDPRISLPMIDRMRAVAHRGTSILICDWIKRCFPEFDCFTTPVLCKSESEVELAVALFEDCMLKAPWSGSGRGVIRVHCSNIENYRAWYQGVLKKQHAVVCEPFLPKEQDFAMEFYSDGSEVKFVGYSIFYNNMQFSYDHSIVGSAASLRSLLSKSIPIAMLAELERIMAACLNHFIPPVYTGYFGVDMMLFRKQDGAVGIMPCVEVNLRQTMGVLSCFLSARILREDTSGTLRILYHKNKQSLESFVKASESPIIRDGKLDKGTLFLVPVYSDSQYTATLTVR